MKYRHITRRPPTKNGGFSWGRFPQGDERVIYRLFRRDHHGAVHLASLIFLPGEPRPHIAKSLRRACHKLRDRVDEIDLTAMGVTA